MLGFQEIPCDSEVFVLHLRQRNIGLGGWGRMKARNVRRLGAAGILLAALVMSVSNAGAAPAQKLTISDAEVTEGGKAVFTVSLTAGKDNSEVTFVTKDGSATVADRDYEAKQGKVTVEAGKTAVIEVQTVQDDKNETDETFTVELTAATNLATIEDGVEDVETSAMGTARSLTPGPTEVDGQTPRCPDAGHVG